MKKIIFDILRKTLKKNIILRKTLEEDTASHAVYPAEQGRRIYVNIMDRLNVK